MRRAADEAKLIVALREIAEGCAVVNPGLFGIESDIVRVRQHTLKQGFCLVKFVQAKVGIDQPEAADQERAFVAFKLSA